MMNWKYLPVAALLILTGCQTMPDTAELDLQAYDLAGTTWMLIEHGSATEGSDLAEVVPYAYTMSLEANGAASFKFDCNRGTGSWNASSMGPEGKITFGFIAVTSALCPDGSIGEQLSGDLPKFIGYSIYDGRLTMGVEKVNRIYVWDSVD